MTQIRIAEVPGAATHAFVIGVGEYPSAKPGRGAIADLRTVKDLPSAADSAKLVCDWLIDNAAKLAAPLATLEVLISDPAGGGERYKWRNSRAVESATSDNVKVAGKRWIGELKAKPGDVAFFYACGHGAGYSGQPVVFLSDLNADDANPWVHHNLGKTASALRQLKEIKAGFFLADSCREFIKNFELNDAQDSRFIGVKLPSFEDRDKVWLLGAASEALLAYEGKVAGSNVKFGRFTKTLLKGLDGASARWRGGKWTVDPLGLSPPDLKMLHRVYFPEWKDRPFEPSQGAIPNDFIPVIHHQNPLLPVVVMTDPEEAIARFDLRIGESSDGQPPWHASRALRAAEAWAVDVNASCRKPLYALALGGAEPYYSLFIPDQPRFEQRVIIA